MLSALLAGAALTCLATGAERATAFGFRGRLALLMLP
jgi:hypothetical protein